jgi:hypothetical protein
MRIKVVIAVMLLPVISPKNGLAAVNSNYYIFPFFKGAFPSFVYIDKTAMQRGKTSQ